jgi:hypothetical protein
MLTKLTGKTLRTTRFLIMLAGVFVSWSTTVDAFLNFYRIEGTIFKIKDCAVPNPVTTPCFWGALAFFVGLIWAYRLYDASSKKGEKYFLFLMIFSVIFAWSNFAVELKGVEAKPGAVIAPCPAGGKNPFLSPCFFGSILFTLSLVTTWILRAKKTLSKNEGE